MAKTRHEFIPQTISEHTGTSLKPYELLLVSHNASFGYLRDWKPNVMAPEKHQAYAVQWFSVAIACLVVFTLLL